MAYVVAATYRTKEGEEDKVLEILQIMEPLSREEPGCLFYQAHRSPEDPRVFFLYEQYADEAAFQAHVDAPHFKQIALGDAIPRLAARERQFLQTVAD